jgi:hypothetical protein
MGMMKASLNLGCFEKGQEMIKQRPRQELYIFSQPKFYLLLVNHGGKICLIILLVMMIVAIFQYRDYEHLSKAFHGIIILVVFAYITVRILGKFANKIIIDFESEKLDFHMNRSDDMISATFEKIKNIRVNGYIIFHIENRKIFYSGAPDSEILSCLSKVKKIDWGPLCAFLGPRKSLRDAFK